MFEKGYLHIYTGNGKGKTTAALGLILRACGAGLKVYLGQFMKRREHSEVVALRRFSDQVTVQQFGSGVFVKGNPSDEDRLKAEEGLALARQAIFSGNYDLVVLDEINVAVANSLIPVGEVLELVTTRPQKVELVLTGRRAHPDLVERADVVTEMVEIRHYYKNGVKAREGIEK